MHTIWVFPIMNKRFFCDLPRGYRVLNVGKSMNKITWQGVDPSGNKIPVELEAGTPIFHVLVDPEQERERLSFYVAKAGEQIDLSRAEYVGSVDLEREKETYHLFIFHQPKEIH